MCLKLRARWELKIGGGIPLVCNLSNENKKGRTQKNIEGPQVWRKREIRGKGLYDVGYVGYRGRVKFCGTLELQYTKSAVILQPNYTSPEWTCRGFRL